MSDPRDTHSSTDLLTDDSTEAQRPLALAAEAEESPASTPADPTAQPAPAAAAPERDVPEVGATDAMGAEPADAATPTASGEPTASEPVALAADAEGGNEAVDPGTPVAAGEGASPAGDTATAAAEGETAPLSARDQTLARIREAMTAKIPLEGTVIGWNKGGFHVSLEGEAAFCPLSQMELGPGPADPASYVDRKFPFRVLREEKEGRRFVVSRAAVLGAERSREQGEVRKKLKAGAVLSGTVSSLPAFGAFVDLGGGVEGLVHVSEISRRRVDRPDEVLQIGQAVEVKVLKVEERGKRISLSMKELEADPWEGLAERYTNGATFSGKIVRQSPFGLFVEVEPGLEGLIHVSQLPPGASMSDAAYGPGQTITGWVREVDPERRRLSLALREVATGDPWKDITERYPEGVLFEGTVEKVTPQGARITLEPGLEGFLPTGEMKLPKGNDPRRVFSPGKKVQVQVTAIEIKRRRIALALQGARVEGSRTDLQQFQRKQDSDRGLGAMASAFARLKRDE